MKEKDNYKIIKAYRLDQRIVELIDKYAEVNKTSSTRVVEYALIEYFLKRNENVMY